MSEPPFAAATRRRPDSGLGSRQRSLHPRHAADRLVGPPAAGPGRRRDQLTAQENLSGRGPDFLRHSAAGFVSSPASSLRRSCAVTVSCCLVSPLLQAAVIVLRGHIAECWAAVPRRTQPTLAAWRSAEVQLLLELVFLGTEEGADAQRLCRPGASPLAGSLERDWRAIPIPHPPLDGGDASDGGDLAFGRGLSSLGRTWRNVGRTRRFDPRAPGGRTAKAGRGRQFPERYPALNAPLGDNGNRPLSGY